MLLSMNRLPDDLEVEQLVDRTQKLRDMMAILVRQSARSVAETYEMIAQFRAGRLDARDMSPDRP